jgi:hypothetical protein
VAAVCRSCRVVVMWHPRVAFSMLQTSVNPGAHLSVCYYHVIQEKPAMGRGPLLQGNVASAP